MRTRRLIVMGTGGHASVVADLAVSAGYEVMGFVGPAAPNTQIGDAPYLGDDDILCRFEADGVCFAVGVGSVREPTVRKRLFEKLHSAGCELPTLVHPRAIVARSARLGAASQVMAGAVVQTHATVGDNVILNTGAIVEHHACIGDHVHVAPGAIVCGTVTIGPGSHIGANATVLQNLTLGAGSVIGAGAVVTRDAPAGSRLKGCPAR